MKCRQSCSTIRDYPLEYLISTAATDDDSTYLPTYLPTYIHTYTIHMQSKVQTTRGENPPTVEDRCRKTDFCLVLPIEDHEYPRISITGVGSLVGRYMLDGRMHNIDCEGARPHNEYYVWRSSIP
ncbi:hypothetical protein BO70DRAFT_17666 [Aspergillus heteromorphus CBS 117.55]|uniref:Uncharacterized protein n=1 Tax=Aspergillus heteromorphus CBS 117.55 TaxID=1448321 RepID=A0A317X2E7_9EURO|nr:uncharacterized protein BO70DRAFT_17666 [Aspergillus heteromorphus CBS 117.55]PWY92733.1 hypothetical protein BO70DRAFT_17666 [Aspergillus heteromorphus CBS 117.55]